MAAFTLAACSGSGSESASPQAHLDPTRAGAAQRTQTPGQPIVLSGQNSEVTDPVTIPAGTYRINWQATGDTNFAVWLQGQDKSLLVNKVLSNPDLAHSAIVIPGPDRGETLFNSLGGQFIIQVEASDSRWQVTFTRLSR